MFPPEMFPNEEPSRSHDLTADDASATLRLTADLFERSAAETTDQREHDALLSYAKLYREMAELTERSDAEGDEEPT